MKDKQGLNRWSLLEQAGTVLDERFHHDAIYSHLVETAAYGRQLEAEIASLRAEVERLEADRATAVVQTESDYQHEIDTLRAEVDRLRLTDAERATLYHLRDWLRHIPDVDALLARLGGGE